jgi:hypothetical protein
MRMKTRENPKTNETVEKTTFFLISELRFSVNSSREKPVIKVKYAGISGSTHGDKKERNPARNAAGNDTASVNMFFLGYPPAIMGIKNTSELSGTRVFSK